ncbi:unnamed protein product [marine sediment metagenome]|uniref:Uncharacterized protein n=1 Tax=marine sediment metagenome TaxID=412755 RepID=X1QP98_9ZZZZ
MPWKMVKRGHPWEGGPDRFVREFFPLSPYEKNLGLKESNQLSTEESSRWHRLELEESLAESASQAAEDRREERGEITREELQQDQKEARRRLGALEGGYFT